MLLYHNGELHYQWVEENAPSFRPRLGLLEQNFQNEMGTI